MLVRIVTPIPFHEQTDLQLAALLKANGVGKQVAWSRFVIIKDLRPGIDAKDFYRLYDRATAEDLAVDDIREVEFVPTHFDNLRGRFVSIIQNDQGVYKMIWDDGSIGSNPPIYPPESDRYIPIQGQPNE